MIWLVFRDGAQKSSEKWSGKSEPIAGKNVPEGSLVVEFNPMDGDENPLNYKLNEKLELVYDPPVPPPVPEPTKEELKNGAYNAELGGFGNQMDAVYKGLSILVPVFIRAGLLTPEQVAVFTPNKEAPPDTPAGWLGKIADIKERLKEE